MRGCDMVALELNPGLWQRDLMKMNMAQVDYANFYTKTGGDFLTEKSFMPEDYFNNLKAALTADPQQINSLLYRTQNYEQDYEEDTYLDLYIYQTGRRLGKKAGGVEDFYETQQIILEAYADMAKEKIKKLQDTDGESSSEIQKKIQQAYRRGDLDLLDSLEKYTFNSPAFLEKFLYKRNEIQAYSIDTILKHNSLFAGVGAAHLPGPRGVIELLRKMGYTLRPVFMQDRDAANKEALEKIKVPVSFMTITTEDMAIQVKVPGPFYKMPSASQYNGNDCWQYADMENGAYYMLTRVKTHAGILGQTALDVLKKTDSLLYENIPGKIISKNVISCSGCSGYEIINRTRRGDLQRYSILIRPFEILIFKMSGNLDYVHGEEANTFFSSIAITQPINKWTDFKPAVAGFEILLPSTPSVLLNTSNTDGIPRWEYEANDSLTGNTYIIWKKTVINDGFLEEDSFDLGLIEQSFMKAELIDKEISRQFIFKDGFQRLRMKFSVKGGGFINAQAILRGPHYYLLAQRTANRKETGDQFFNSFKVTDFEYCQPSLYTDTLLNFSVNTPVQPTLDSTLVAMVNLVMKSAGVGAQYEGSGYWPTNRNALFKSDSSGEAVLVSTYEYQKYFFSKDSARFWKNELDTDSEKDLYLAKKIPVSVSDSCKGYQLIWRDTNTIRQIISYALLQQNTLYMISAIDDTVMQPSAFIKEFFNSFKPIQKKSAFSVFTPKTDLFFTDLYSKDSLIKAKARKAITNVYYGPENINMLVQHINSLQYGEEDYFEMKARFISELGYIDDSCCTDSVVFLLNDIYTKTADTSYFQNEVFWSLLNLKTTSSFAILKTLLLQDPPVFEGKDDYYSFFELMEDSLKLSATLFPDLLQLATIEDYKAPVNKLLALLLDSGYISTKDYESYFGKLYFDAKIEMKKQQQIEEKLQEKEIQKDIKEDGSAEVYTYEATINTSFVKDYAPLLVPFYDSKPGLPKFFDKLLQSRDTSLQLYAAVLLIRNHKKVADSILIKLAAKDNFRSSLWRNLEYNANTNLFPENYKTQPLMARALLLENGSASAFDTIQEDGKQNIMLNGEKGWVYFFRYKIHNDDEWQMGISGPQPDVITKVGINDILTSMTEKKLSADIPVLDQYNEQLRKLIFRQHKSAAHFYEADDYGNYEYED